MTLAVVFDHVAGRVITGPEAEARIATIVAAQIKRL